jgi:hypothetical protein
MLATGASSMSAGSDEGATSAIGAVSDPRSVSSTLDDVAAESFDAAREITVVSLARGVVALASGRDLPLGLSRGGVDLVAGEFDPCEVVGSGVEGTANVAVGVAVPPGEPPVLGAAPDAAVCEPTEGVDDGEVPDAVDGVEDPVDAEVSAL